MAHDQPVPERHPQRLLNVILVLTLLCAVGGIAAIVVTAPEIPPVDETSFRTSVEVDESRLDEERAFLYQNVDLRAHTEKIAALQKSVREANLLQFGTPSPKALRDAAVMNTYNANEVLAATSIEGVMLAGNEVFEACQAGLAELQAALASKKITAQEARTDPGERFATYRENCGNAFGPLEEMALIRPDGAWVDPAVGPTILDIFNRFRWATILDARRPALQQLTPYDYELLTRWRAANPAFPVQKRIEWVERAARELPGLARDELLGNLHFEAGDRSAATEAYARACARRQQDLHLQAKCAWLASH